MFPCPREGASCSLVPNTKCCAVPGWQQTWAENPTLDLRFTRTLPEFCSSSDATGTDPIPWVPRLGTWLWHPHLPACQTLASLTTPPAVTKPSRVQINLYFSLLVEGTGINTPAEQEPSSIARTTCWAHTASPASVDPHPKYATVDARREMGDGLGVLTLPHGPSVVEGTSCCVPPCCQALHAPLPDTVPCCRNVQAPYFCFYFPCYLLPSVLGPMTDMPPMSKSTCGNIPSPPKREYHRSASWFPLVPWSSPVPASSPPPGSGGGGRCGLHDVGA